MHKLLIILVAVLAVCLADLIIKLIREERKHKDD